MPHAIKMAVGTRQEWHCACGCKGWLLFGQTEFDHNPALMNRAFDPVTNTYTPDANDPAFIQAFTTGCHALKTFGPGGERRITTRGSDIGEAARTTSIASKHQAHLQAMAAKQCGQPRQPKSSFARRVAR
jgi:hypothetical protein